MSKIIWFCYGFFSALSLILLGLVGFGTSILIRLIQYAPLGLLVVTGFIVVIMVLYWIIKPSEKKQITT